LRGGNAVTVRIEIMQLDIVPGFPESYVLWRATHSAVCHPSDFRELCENRYLSTFSIEECLQVKARSVQLIRDNRISCTQVASNAQAKEEEAVSFSQ